MVQSTADELGGGLHLRQHDAVHAASDHRLQVVEAGRRIESVDSHIAQGTARRLKRGDHLLASVRLLGDRDGVLEVENHHVRVEGERLFDASGVIARREQQRSGDDHGDPRCVLVCEAVVDT